MTQRSCSRWRQLVFSSCAGAVGGGLHRLRALLRKVPPASRFRRLWLHAAAAVDVFPGPAARRAINNPAPGRNCVVPPPAGDTHGPQCPVAVEWPCRRAVPPVPAPPRLPETSPPPERLVTGDALSLRVPARPCCWSWDCSSRWANHRVLPPHASVIRHAKRVAA